MSTVGGFLASACLLGTLFTPTIAYWSIEKPLGKRRKSLAFWVTAFGFLTFFLPLITINPPVIGRTQWSAFGIVREMYQGTLPVSGDIIDTPFLIAAIYLLMALILVVLFFSSSPNVLLKAGAAGGVLSTLAWKWSKADFESFFYGDVSHRNSFMVRHVSYGLLPFVLFLVMATLVFIGLREDLDSELLRKETQIRDSSSPSGEPEFVDAEMLSAEEGTKRPYDTRRLHD